MLKTCKNGLSVCGLASSLISATLMFSVSGGSQIDSFLMLPTSIKPRLSISVYETATTLHNILNIIVIINSKIKEIRFPTEFSKRPLYRLVLLSFLFFSSLLLSLPLYSSVFKIAMSHSFSSVSTLSDLLLTRIAWRQNICIHPMDCVHPLLNMASVQHGLPSLTQEHAYKCRDRCHKRVCLVVIHVLLSGWVRHWTILLSSCIQWVMSITFRTMVTACKLQLWARHFEGRSLDEQRVHGACTKGPWPLVIAPPSLGTLNALPIRNVSFCDSCQPSQCWFVCVSGGVCVWEGGSMGG